jgi:hypothetical protein
MSHFVQLNSKVAEIALGSFNADLVRCLTRVVYEESERPRFKSFVSLTSIVVEELAQILLNGRS